MLEWLFRVDNKGEQWEYVIKQDIEVRLVKKLVSWAANCCRFWFLSSKCSAHHLGATQVGGWKVKTLPF